MFDITLYFELKVTELIKKMNPTTNFLIPLASELKNYNTPCTQMDQKFEPY